MPYTARKPMTIAGVDYRPRDHVPLEGLPRKLRAQLIDQRKVVLEATPEEAETESKGFLRLKRKRN